MVEHESVEDLRRKFLVAAEEIKLLSQKPCDEELLLLYGLYKQANEGSCKDSQKPSFFDLKNMSKWNAWDANRGMSKSKAMKEYIQVVDDLKKKYRLFISSK